MTRLLITYALTACCLMSLGAQNYCTPSFSGDCGPSANEQYVSRVNILEPAGSITDTVFSGTRLGHCPTAYSCNAGITDYQYHQISEVNTICPGFSTFGIGPSAYPSEPINQGVTRGGSFDFFVYGNTITSTSHPNAMALSVFVDWNADGDFNEANEVIISTPIKTWAQPNPSFFPNADQNVYAINVPITAICSMTRMRVIASKVPYNIDACLVAAQGSARDYDLEIKDVDTDQDGICDLLDLCPDWNDNLLGTPCDDGFDNTSGETYTDCETCTGVNVGCPADIDGSGIVDIDDFLLFSVALGNACSACSEDVNGDGSINIGDFLLLNSQFGWICGP